MPAAKTAASGKGGKGRKAADTRPVSDKLIDAALDLAATHRWRDLSLAAIADEAGVPIGDALGAVSGRDGIIALLGKRIDAQVLASLENDPLDGSTKDKLFDLLMRRFDMIEGRQAAIAAIAADTVRDPFAAACLGRRFLGSMALMLEAAGVPSGGCVGMIRTKALGAIQLSALRAWLKDEDPGLASTMSVLDKGLRRAEQLAGKVGKPRESEASA